MFALRLLSRLPLPVLYVLSDILYFFARYLIGYRKKVIDDNLKGAFPRKSRRERNIIRNKFYRNFTDSFAEMLKDLTLSEAELSKRFKIINPESLDQLVGQDTSVILLVGHMFNWEMGLLAANYFCEAPVECIYLQVKNPTFDQFMLESRTRFGGTMTEKRDSLKSLSTLGTDARIMILAADQRPPNTKKRYTKLFMNREAAFFEGGEISAKKYDLPVMFGKFLKPKRGHYTLEFIPVAYPPYTDSLPHSITDKYSHLLEENILEQPELYLWSHKRWKL